MESRSFGESRLSISYDCGSRNGELKGSHYGESRSTINGGSTQSVPVKNDRIQKLTQELENLKEELLIAEQERALRQQINEIQEQIAIVRNQDNPNQGNLNRG